MKDYLGNCSTYDKIDELFNDKKYLDYKVDLCKLLNKSKMELLKIEMFKDMFEIENETDSKSEKVDLNNI